MSPRQFVSARFNTRRVLYSTCVVAVVGFASLTLSMWDEIQAYQEAKVFEAQFDAAKQAPPLSVKNPPGPETFKPIRVLPRLRAITEIPVVSAAEASKIVDDDELVLGIEINGKSRAYPLNMLNGPFREIFNDELGGTAIAATW